MENPFLVKYRKSFKKEGDEWAKLSHDYAPVDTLQKTFKAQVQQSSWIWRYFKADSNFKRMSLSEKNQF